MNGRKKKKVRLLLYIPFWILIVGMFMGLFAIQYARYQEYRSELDRLIAELTLEEQAAADLQNRVTLTFLEMD